LTRALSLASGLWPLASGLWLLASGFWLLASGFWLLASGEGEVTARASRPDEKAMPFMFASPRALTDVYLQPLDANARPTRVTQGGTDSFYRIAWAQSDFVKLNDADGNPVYARVYRPKAQHANRPTVFEIHGAGYAQAVHKSSAGSSAHGVAERPVLDRQRRNVRRPRLSRRP
jgi:dipeptidyl aminopeptidase/acylaminoacyl peptidase